MQHLPSTSTSERLHYCCAVYLYILPPITGATCHYYTGGEVATLILKSIKKFNQTVGGPIMMFLVLKHFMNFGQKHNKNNLVPRFAQGVT